MEEDKKDEAVKEEIVSSDSNSKKEGNKLVSYVLGIVVLSIVAIIIVLLVTDTDNNKSNNENKEETNTIVEKDNKEVTNTENKEITNTEVTNTEVTNTEIEPDQPKEIVGTEITDPNIIAELDNYFNLIEDYSSNPEELHYGIDKVNKIKLSLKYLFNNNIYTKITRDNLPEKYVGDKYFEDTFDYPSPVCLLELKYSDFENTSEKLFGEKISMDEAISINYDKEIGRTRCAFCTYANYEGRTVSPCISNKFDDELETMYFNICACGGGLTGFEIKYDKEKYTEDEEYYYMYINANEIDLVHDDAEIITYYFVVKLDKDFKILDIQ